jgi:hypothetical protein
MEVSAKSFQNIKHAFNNITRKIYQNIEDGVIDTSNESSGIQVDCNT